MAVFKARYKGTCQKCNLPVEPGQYVSWSRRTRGVIYHATCAGEVAPDDGTPQPTPQPSPDAPGDSPAPQPQPQPSPAPGIDEGRVREIAREVAQNEDAAHLKSVLKAVDKRLAKHVPTVVKVTVRAREGEAPREAIAESVHHRLAELVYLAGKRRHTYLYGPPGSGKSTAAVQAAKVLGMRYGYTSLNPQTPESRLLGYMDAGGTYRATEFYRCYVEGGVFCIDELDNGHPATLNTLNGMLETDADGIGRGAFPCGVVERHPDFVCVATGNTNGRGADKLFPERRALDAAFLERFTFLLWEYDLALERSVTLGINPDAGAWLEWVRSVRDYARARSLRLWASPRACFHGAELLRDSGWSTRAIADAVLFKGLDGDTVDAILAACPLPAVEVAE